MSSLALGARISLALERHALRTTFRIARGGKTHVDVLVATVTEGALRGVGEAVPYARYGESGASVLELAARNASHLVDVREPEALRALLPRGALRNALDLALWDLRAKRERRSVASLLGRTRRELVASAATLSLDAPEEMARVASRTSGTLLKIKLAGDAHDRSRLLAVHAARPDARLWLDANEGLDREGYLALVELLEALPIVLLEQPFPEGADEALDTLPRPVPVCADESVHDAASLDALAQRYDAVNVKLDKTGGLTEALDTVARARALGRSVVLGCMVSSSLALAPAFLLAPDADLVDLDGALFLAADREGGTTLLEDGLVRAPAPALWGAATSDDS